jgi:hypothetical protein
VKFTLRYEKMRLDMEAYKKALDAAMMEHVANGAASWLDAVIVEIPVWSGASRATFLKLAREIEFSIAINPKVIDRIATGQAHSIGSLLGDIKTGSYTFQYGTTLPWLIWNEYNNANINPDPTLIDKLIKPGPYNFQDKGNEAFVRMARTARLPSVASFVKSFPARI